MNTAEGEEKNEKQFIFNAFPGVLLFLELIKEKGCRHTRTAFTLLI
jgi:hypothetical protein